MSRLAWYGCCGLAMLGAHFVFRRLSGDGDAPADEQRRSMIALIRDKLLECAFVAGLWPLTLVLWIAEWRLRRHHPKTEQKFALGPTHLVARLDIEDIEILERVTDPLGAVPDLPFGFLHEAWRAFIARRAPHQLIWSFTAVHPGWGMSLQLSGYVLVGDDGIGEHFTVASRVIEPAREAPLPKVFLRARYD